MSVPRILMCRPDYFGIEYEINPWMDVRAGADQSTATQQWEALRTVLLDAGAEIEELPAIKGMPDLVFTANAGLVFGRHVIVSRFRHRQRQCEEPHWRRWFREHGFSVETVPAETNFEGAGDALFCGETLIAGYRIRSDALGHQQIAARLGCRVLPVELVNDQFYHLDTCFCPLSPSTAIWYPPAFDEYGRRAIEAAVDELIEVDDTEARRFACNAVVVGQTVVTNTGCDALATELSARGYTPRQTPLDEFTKAGGSAKCLTLRLDGEDAAAWRSAKTCPGVLQNDTVTKATDPPAHV